VVAVDVVDWVFGVVCRLWRPRKPRRARRLRLAALLGYACGAYFAGVRREHGPFQSRPAVDPPAAGGL